MRRTIVLALVLAVISLGVGILVAAQAFPSEDDIERVTIEEIAEDNPLLGTILASPLIEQFLDQTFGETQKEVQDRVIDESRSALYLGAGAYMVVLVLGVGLIAADHRRRHVGEATPTGTVTHQP
jgi:hypothetical protein